MSKTQRTTVMSSAGLIDYQRFAPRPAGTKLQPLFASLVIVALFGGWIGFWVAAIWWLAR